MAYDAHKNFAYSTVPTAPSPPASGTSLVVQAGDGAKFPTPPFNATVWPAGVEPLSGNAEIVRVTAIATDTFTIVRTQEGSSARSIAGGDQIAANITVKTLTDAEDKPIFYHRQIGTSPELWYPASMITAGSITGATSLFTTFRAFPFLSHRGGTLDRIGCRVTTAATGGRARLGIYKNTSDTNLYPGALLIDAGEITTDTTGAKTLAISQALDANTLYWLAIQPTAGTFRSIPVAYCFPILGVSSGLGDVNPYVHWQVSRTYGPLPDPFTSGATAQTSNPVLVAVRFSA